MSFTCRGTCEMEGESQLKLGYKNGQKFCKVCGKYTTKKITRCYCCNVQLRTSKKHNKLKKEESSTSLIKINGYGKI